VRKDHRPIWMKRLQRRVQRARVRRFLEPQFDAVGPHLDAGHPRYINVHGPNISLGRCATLRAMAAYPLTFTTWVGAERQGRIDMGDYLLISPGTRILASEHVHIGTNTMIAGEVYISDSDWHHVYNRTAEGDAHKPIHIGQNVWLGYGVKVCKGVTIGENTVIGAGSVVTRPIPANVIAAGNPARPVRDLDPDRAIVRRQDLYADPPKVEAEMDQLDAVFLKDNTLLKWLRVSVAPKRED